MERNDTILRAVALGYTLRQVGEIFDISFPRVRQISLRRLAHYDMRLWRSIAGQRGGGCRVIRDNREDILDMIAGRRKVTYSRGGSNR